MTFWWAKESIGSDRGLISDLVTAGGIFWDRQLTEASFINFYQGLRTEWL